MNNDWTPTISTIDLEEVDPCEDAKPAPTNVVPIEEARRGIRTTIAREVIDRAGGGVGITEEMRGQMTEALHRPFREKYGYDVPAEWISWEVVEDRAEHTVELRLKAEATTKAQEVYDMTRGEPRQLPITVTPEAKILIARSHLVGEHPVTTREAGDIITFKGWDPETGLMAFGL